MIKTFTRNFCETNSVWMFSQKSAQSKEEKENAIIQKPIIVGRAKSQA